MGYFSNLLPGREPAGFQDPVAERAYGASKRVRQVAGFTLLLVVALLVALYVGWVIPTARRLTVGSAMTPLDGTVHLSLKNSSLS